MGRRNHPRHDGWAGGHCSRPASKREGVLFCCGPDIVHNCFIVLAGGRAGASARIASYQFRRVMITYEYIYFLLWALVVLSYCMLDPPRSIFGGAADAFVFDAHL